MKPFTDRHKEVFKGLGVFSDRILYGPFGCGKTHTVLMAFGIYLLQLNKYTDKRFNFVLIGRTQLAVKRNLCNVLSTLFGKNFRYDGSRKSGMTRDAVLFGHSIFIVGLNDEKAEERVRGLTDIVGMIHDEVSICSEAQYSLIKARLRGATLPPEVPKKFRAGWYIGTTNPDVPTHWIKKKAENGAIELIRWGMADAIWDGADEYYAGLKLEYKDNPVFYQRYLLGEWVAGDNTVYPQFTHRHILKDVDIDYSMMKDIYLAADYGSTHPTAILVILQLLTGEYVVDKEFKFEKTAPSDIVRTLSLGIREYNKINWTVYVDPAAQALKDELRKYGYKVVNALNSRSDGIACIRTLLSRQELFIRSRCTNTCKEMYEYKFKNPEVSEDVLKIDDDFVDALRYGIYSHVKGR